MEKLYAPEVISHEDWLKVIKETETESDRAAAIVMGSLVELTVERCMLLRLLPMTDKEYRDVFDGQGPLKTFSAKIRVGRLLGLYGPKTMEVLTRIKTVRNRFAHDFHVDFSHDLISGQCERLPDYPALQQLAEQASQTDHGKLMRTRFRNTVLHLVQTMPREVRVVVPPPSPIKLD